MSEAKLLNYKASPTGARFHSSNAFVRGIMGPFGCVAPETRIVTEFGLVAISEIDRPMRVLSWNAELGQYQLSLSGGAFPKGRDYLYRVTTRQGEFVSTGHHRILCVDGSYQRVDSLVLGQSVSLCSGDLSETSSDTVSRLPLDARHCSEILVDSLGRYAESARQYGLQLLLEEGSGQESVPLQGGVQLSDQNSLHEGGLEGLGHLHSRNDLCDGHLSKLGSDCLSELPEQAEEDYTSSLPCGHSGEIGQQSQQSAENGGFHPKDGLSSGYSHSYSQIVQIQKEPIQREYWDMQVLDTNNYVTEDGVIHHNSGKSVAMCWEIFMRSREQVPGKDGLRKTRWIVARNTQPQLETTTIKTWLDWFPEHIFGKMSRKPPFTHTLKFADVEAEVIFLAMDKPDDVKKLLSFEVTGVFFNEAREMDYEIVAGATGRVGRYPSKKDKPDHVPDEEWPTWHGIIMDTNPPDDEHWWYKMAEEDGWAMDKHGNRIDPDKVPKKQHWEFWQQPSGLSAEAENIDNLPGGYDYYTQQLGGKTKEWINVYVHGQYGTIQHGLPVYGDSFNADVHVAERVLDIIPAGLIYVGIDASGRHPAAVFIQRTYNGQFQVVHELCVTSDAGMGAENFSILLKNEMGRKFPNHDFDCWGDPAGAWGQNTDERTYFDILKAQGIHCKASPGLRIPERKEAIISILSRNIEGKPAMLISPNCKMLVRGFQGGYKYRQLGVSGDARYDTKPEKNRYSDVQDALQYVICGSGERKRMYGQNRKVSQTHFASTGFKVF